MNCQAWTPINELLNLDALQLERIKDTLHAYQMENAAT